MFGFKINTSGVDLSGYKFIVKASNTNNFETDKTTADVTYTYQLYSQSNIDAITFTKATEPTLVKSTYALKEGNKCIFSGASVYDELKTILGVSAKEDIKDFYIRWTVKHTDDTKVDNLTVSSGKYRSVMILTIFSLIIQVPISSQKTWMLPLSCLVVRLGMA